MKKDGKFTRVNTSSFNEVKLKQLKPNTFYEMAVSAVIVSEGPKGYFNFTTKVGGRIFYHTTTILLFYLCVTS